MEVVRQQWEEGLIDRTWQESLSLVRMTKILIRRRIIERKTFFRSSLVGEQDGGCWMGEARHCVHLCQWSGHCQQWSTKASGWVQYINIKFLDLVLPGVPETVHSKHSLRLTEGQCLISNRHPPKIKTEMFLEFKSI